jgi:hypothetical protein
VTNQILSTKPKNVFQNFYAIGVSMYTNNKSFRLWEVLEHAFI